MTLYTSQRACPSVRCTTVGASFGPYTDHSVLYRTTLSVTCPSVRRKLGLTYTSIGRASLVTKHTRHCGRF